MARKVCPPPNPLSQTGEGIGSLRSTRHARDRPRSRGLRARAPRQPDLGRLAPELCAACGPSQRGRAVQGPGLERVLPDRARRAGDSRSARGLERAAIARHHARARRAGASAPRARRGGCHCDRALRGGGRRARGGGAVNAALALDARIPAGALESKWDAFKAGARLVSPANRRRYSVIVVGAGLAGASAAASLAELGYDVTCFCFQDSPRRAHSIAAQGGINAAKNYANDGDSVHRLFYDTIKGGDFRAREANVYRLAQVSVNIIDQCVAQGVPFAREYGGLLTNRSFGGAQVSRTFYARGQTGQQLLLGAYQALSRQIG